MITVNVSTSPAYKVEIGASILANALPQAIMQMNCTEAMIVSDSNVASLYLGDALSAVRTTGIRVGSTIFPAGEENKKLDTVQDILVSFADFNLTRSGAVIALGGGVTGDMAGFAAAIWLRGIPVIQLPTSLLAMVDSSVGGKTGVDLAVGKNLVGAFHQPEHVIADTDLLKTLPKDRQLDGMAEMLKVGILMDASLFQKLVQHPETALHEEAIARSVEIKADIVSRDPHEKGERKLLNLGHTAGHAIEQVSNFKISHGFAVAIGTLMAAQAGVRAGLTSTQCRDHIKQALINAGLPTESPYPAAQLIDAMLKDKKRAGEQITLVIPHDIGNCVLHKIPVRQLQDFWQGTEM